MYEYVELLHVVVGWQPSAVSVHGHVCTRCKKYRYTQPIGG